MESRLAYVVSSDGTTTVQTVFSKRTGTPLDHDERTVEEMVNEGVLRGEDLYADSYRRLRNSFFYKTRFEQP